MKNIVLGMMILAVSCVITQPLLAGGPETPQTRPTTAPAVSKSELAEKIHERLIEKLKLSDPQHKPVRKILADYRNEVADWDKGKGLEMVRLRRSMKLYHGPKDPNTIEKVKKSMVLFKQLKSQRAEIDTRLLAKLKEALRPEQFQTARQTLNPRKRPPPSGVMGKFHMLGELDLTTEQLTRITTIVDEAKKGSTAAATNGMADQRILQGAWNKIVKDVLTDADRETLKDHMRRASNRRMLLRILESVTLTKVQSTKVDVIWNKAYQDAKKNPDARYEIYGKARKEILENVLTEEQRDQIELRRRQKSSHMGMPRGMPGAR